MTQPPRKPRSATIPTGDETELVRSLAKLLQDSDLSEIEVQKNDFRVRVARHVSAAPLTHFVAAAPAADPPASAFVVTAPVIDPDLPNPNAVPSPMVGTAYRRSAPGSKAFVEIGAKVGVGDKILLIEAMKTFNDIASPRAGTVTAILVEDGQPVEYGQPLLVIE